MLDALLCKIGFESFGCVFSSIVRTKSPDWFSKLILDCLSIVLKFSKYLGFGFDWIDHCVAAIVIGESDKVDCP